VDFGKERRADTSPTDIPFSITSRVASSRNSFVYQPCGIFSMDDTSVLSPYKFSKLWCPLFSAYLSKREVILSCVGLCLVLRDRSEGNEDANLWAKSSIFMPEIDCK
jgi:hypothetical protein